MSHESLMSPPTYSTQDILAARPPRNAVDLSRPYAFHVEPEHTATGDVEDVATLFLTNRECPYQCLMCDLWKSTTTTNTPRGAIPAQIDFALSRLPPAQHVKLYNSGNFFDKAAIPPEDYALIADRVRRFQTVIVENHPRLCSEACLGFADLLDGRLEVALGLETVHPEVLPRLNKQMTLKDFERAAGFLRKNDIDVRAFILLRPPFLDEQQGIDWAIRSLEYAFSIGVGCCTVIPTRAGNGIMERLQADGLFSPPALRALEQALDAGLRLGGGRVFVDLWDVQKLAACPECGAQRIERMRQMNLSQQISPPVRCDCENPR